MICSLRYTNLCVICFICIKAFSLICMFMAK